jgi:hypothetical protein
VVIAFFLDEPSYLNDILNMCTQLSYGVSRDKTISDDVLLLVDAYNALIVCFNEQVCHEHLLRAISLIPSNNVKLDKRKTVQNGIDEPSIISKTR